MARKPNPDTVDRVVELSPEQMFEFRKQAVVLALQLAHTPRPPAIAEVLHNAGIILMFLMQGEPVYQIEESVEQHPMPAPELEPVKVIVSAPKASAPVPAPAPKAAPAVSTAPNPTPPASSATSTVPPPVAIKAVADKLVALVQDKARGGRAAAEALLKKYGVAQLAQIPGAKLAEFAKECDTFTLAASDPTGGLLG